VCCISGLQPGTAGAAPLSMASFGQIFSASTQAIFYNWKPNPVQRMLDFDFLCGVHRQGAIKSLIHPAPPCHPVSYAHVRR